MDDPIDSDKLHSMPDVLGGMTEKEFEEVVKKTLDLFENSDYVAGIQKLLHIISKQNPNLN